MYMNIGDHLIAHGTFHFFEKNRIPIRRACGIEYYKPSWIDETEVLVFGGGGNFGDLYRIHQIRMNLVCQALAKGKTVIVLPQSLWYENSKNIEIDQKKIAWDDNFHLFTRDEQSLAIGKQVAKNVYLVPDMAHHLYDELCRLTSGIKPSKQKMFFLRNDSEALPGREVFFQRNVVFDWGGVLKLEDCGTNLARIFKLYKWIMRRLHLPFDKELLLWRKYSWDVITVAAKFFCEYDTVFTDRLHGMIFAALLNRKFEILDNSYGKLSNYKECWFDSDSMRNI